MSNQFHEEFGKEKKRPLSNKKTIKKVSASLKKFICENFLVFASQPPVCNVYEYPDICVFNQCVKKH